MSILAPFSPTSDRPWDRAAAAHLLRRAGFAPSPAEMARVLDEGPRRAAERLVNDAAESSLHDELDAVGSALAVRDDIAALRGWWLLRMCRTSRPLHARLALMWHNHFATSNAKVRSAAFMLQQLRTIERLGAGPFDQLLLGMARDPAMLVWLDSGANVKGRANENFARELFELFSLAPGNYSEQDIREAARAFTGWQQRNGRFYFAKLDHDAGEKVVLGQRGRFAGEDIVQIACAQAACARFLALRLLREFVTPEPEAALVDALAGELSNNRLHIGQALIILLSSSAMFDPAHRLRRIKSPVELAVGMVRSLELKATAEGLASLTAQAGQRLFEPPSVKGWDGHRAWLNSAAMLVRMNGATRAVEGALPADAIVASGDLRDAAAVRSYCLNVALGGEDHPALAAQLREIDGRPAEVLRRALLVLLTSPEYQLA